MRSFDLLGDALVALLGALPEGFALPGEPIPPDAAAFINPHRYAPALPAYRCCDTRFIRSPCRTVSAVIRPGCPEVPCSRNNRFRAAAFHSAHDITRSGDVEESTATSMRFASWPSLRTSSRGPIFGESPGSEPTKPTKPGFDGFVGSLCREFALIASFGCQSSQWRSGVPGPVFTCAPSDSPGSEPMVVHPNENLRPEPHESSQRRSAPGRRRGRDPVYRDRSSPSDTHRAL